MACKVKEKQLKMHIRGKPVQRRESAEALERMFGRIVRELGEYAERILRIQAEEIGGYRLTFPDVQDICRMVRNRQI